MEEPKRLTARVLSVSFEVRQLETVDGRRQMDSQGNYLRGILASYEGAMGDDYAQRLITGRQTVPKALAVHYSDDIHTCPQGLYEDIASYYQSDSISYDQHITLRANLLRILQTLPVVDQEEIYREVRTCRSAVYETYMLLAGLLYYAWRADLAGYTYVAA